MILITILYNKLKDLIDSGEDVVTPKDVDAALSNEEKVIAILNGTYKPVDAKLAA